MITVIGRGHSGTRAISHTLTQSGVFMGGEINTSGDLIPGDDMYEACRVMGKHVKYLGNLQWDFSALHTMEIPTEFTKLIESYLASVLDSDEPLKGWKIPETTLVYPWIIRMFPDIKYIYWVRDPRDSTLGGHLTDDLADFNVDYDKSDDEKIRRAISWKYQVEIFNNTPRPKNMIEVKFEDFVMDQENTLKRLEDYLEIPLKRIEVRPEAVGRWKTSDVEFEYSIFEKEIQAFGYEEQSA